MFRREFLLGTIAIVGLIVLPPKKIIQPSYDLMPLDTSIRYMAMLCKLSVPIAVFTGGSNDSLDGVVSAAMRCAQEHGALVPSRYGEGGYSNTMLHPKWHIETRTFRTTEEKRYVRHA